MMLVKSYNNIVQKTLNQFHHASFPSIRTHLRCYKSSRRLPSSNLLETRHFSSGTENSVIFPPLADDPPILWPSLFKRLNNLIQMKFVIQPLLDSNFSIPEFLEGSTQALVIISNALAREDYESIQDLVTTDAINKVKTKISSLSPEQKHLIAVNKKDLYFAFPHEIEVIYGGDESHQRYVQIMVVHQALLGLGTMRDNGEEPPITMGIMPEFQRRFIFSNYRFIREFTKGVESSWTVNFINHFMPASLV